ncbi:monovalent cation/H(+) antiporter subunit G [Sciscionella sediminilitoris]|uniref:monovalent cation/H(+) antiporter subunit G n=1 Tax=Sciscionella sediminilitoris TaxID=1445613 RepID=UPI0004DEE668|nr:monovalent cation/H(+) antiporter subunit G [Sciscionella sp. SE31]
MNVLAQSVTGAGVVLVVAGTLGAVFAAANLVRLHYLSAITLIGCPLIGAGLVVTDGFSLTSAMVALTTVTLALTGPVLSTSTGRFLARIEDEP